MNELYQKVKCHEFYDCVTGQTRQLLVPCLLCSDSFHILFIPRPHQHPYQFVEALCIAWGFLRGETSPYLLDPQSNPNVYGMQTPQSQPPLVQQDFTHFGQSI